MITELRYLEYRDLLQSLAAKLYSLPDMHAHFVQAKLDFSLLGIGISLENATPITDIESAVELMLAELFGYKDIWRSLLCPAPVCGICPHQDDLTKAA